MWAKCIQIILVIQPYEWTKSSVFLVVILFIIHDSIIIAYYFGKMSHIFSTPHHCNEVYDCFRDTSRILEPVIYLEFILDSGKPMSVEMPISKFHSLRHSVALLLKEMDSTTQRLSHIKNVPQSWFLKIFMIVYLLNIICYYCRVILF